MVNKIFLKYSMFSLLLIFSCKHNKHIIKSKFQKPFLEKIDSYAGVWESQDDGKSVIRINKSQWIDIYNNQTIDTFQIKIDTLSCDLNYQNALIGDYIIKEKINEYYCYEVVSLNQNFLAIRYTLNGKISVYKKNCQ